MSLILDALRQSQQRDGPVSTDDTLTTGSGTPTAKRALGVTALLVGTILGAGAVAIWQWAFVQVSGSGEATTPLSASPVGEIPSDGQPYSSAGPGSVHEPIEQTPPLSRPLTLPPEPSHSAGGEPWLIPNRSGQVTDDEQIASLHQQMWADAESGGAAAMPPLQAQSAAGEGRSDASDQQAREGQSIPPPIDLAKAMENAARELRESALSSHPTPLLENLSQQQKDQIPTIVYSVHEYGPQAVASVMLNGKRLQSGQRADTVEVIEILSDSVILRAQGIEFRLKALNTWLNL